MEPERARELLTRERERIEAELKQFRTGREGDELSAVDQHPADSGTELFERERDDSLIETLEDELGAIKRAVKRLEDGKYGRSVESGDPIPDERLEAIPHADRTAEEQGRIEQQTRR